MSANPPKNDAWPDYPDVRFVLVRNIGRLRPGRGLVLDWDPSPGRRMRSALVVWYDDAALRPITKMDWLPREQLIPVRVDPNWTGVPERSLGSIG